MRNSLGSKVIRNCWRRWHGFGGRTRLCLERENRPDQRCVYVDKRGQNDSGLNIATCDDLWAWQMMALEKHLDALRSENTSLKERIVSQGHKLMEVEGELQKRDSMDVHRTVSDRKWLSTRAEIVNIMNPPKAYLLCCFSVSQIQQLESERNALLDYIEDTVDKTSHLSRQVCHAPLGQEGIGASSVP